MKCKVCGAVIDDGELFCGECGTRVDVNATSDAVFCEKCGTKNSARDRFCGSCGAVLGSTSYAQATAAPKTANANRSILPVAISILVVVVIAIGGGIGYVMTKEQDDHLMSTTSTTTSSQRSDFERHSQNTSRNYAREKTDLDTGIFDPASFEYVPCSGYVQADTKDGSLLNIRPAPSVVDPIVFQVPDNSKLRVNGWSWDDLYGDETYWLRVTDHGGHVLGWVSQEFCNLSSVDFHGTRPYASNWTSADTRSGPNVRRKYDPADFEAYPATGHITVTAQNHDLNVRPAPGVVDDVVFIITDKYGCKVNGWSYDRFESGSDRIWLRLTDNHDNILGWVNAKYCNTKYVEFL